MNLIQSVKKLLTRGESREQLFLSSSKDPALISLFGGKSVAAGVTVTEATAMNLTAVYGCVKVISEDLASLPFIVYRRVGDGKDRAVDHPLFSLLHDAPNPEMTSLEFREALQAHMLLWGNAYAEIEQDIMGRPVHLWPLSPDVVRIQRLPSGMLAYFVADDAGVEHFLRQDQVMHLRGLGSDGVVGFSPITMARQAIGLSIAEEEYRARFFANDTTPSGLLEHPGELKKEAQERLRESWERLHSGLSGKHRIAVLEAGMKWQSIGMPAQDAQFMQGRKFQIAEIARIYRMPLHKIQEMDKATFSNIEQQALEYVTDTLRPWLVRWEQRVKQSLIVGPDQKTIFAEFLIDGLLRGDVKSRNEAYAIGRQWGWYSANDILRLENRNPIGSKGDEYLVPMNMVPAGSSRQQSASRRQQAAINGNGHEMRSSFTRRHLGQSHQRVFEEVVKEILRAERVEILKMVMKNRGARAAENLVPAFESFYLSRPAFINRQIAPVMTAYSDAIGADAARELDLQVEEVGESFVRQYLDTFVTRYTESSLGQLREIVNLNPSDPLPAIEQRLAEWLETRPTKIAKRETVKLANAAAKETYKKGGVTRLRWVTFGKNCPFCNSLDGRVVGIQTSFVNQGETFQPEGAPTPITPRTNIGHAPIHRACDCGIEAA